jgi:protein-tyrosine phosphatase
MATIIAKTADTHMISKRRNITPLSFIAGVVLCTMLAGCGGSEANKNADQRIIPSELPADQRQAWRKLPLQEASNFRDLGGYHTVDGRQVQWGKLYRSDSLGNLTDQDLRYLQRLKLKQVVDFRSDIERQAEPDRVPEGAELVIRKVTVEGTDIHAMQAQITDGTFGDNDFSAMLVDANKAFVSDFTPEFKGFIQSLAEDDNLPLVFHCTAGKDRTGFAAAIALIAIGVPEETVKADFLLTNSYTEDIINKRIWMIRFASLFRTSADQVRPLLGVEAQYLQAAFDTIDQQYGSMDNYLLTGLGITPAIRQKLRANLLAPAP